MSWKGKWWDCAYCNARDNPPEGKRCLRCHRDRKERKPIDPNAKFNFDELIDTISQLVKVLSVVSFFVPVLRPYVATAKTVLAVVQRIQKELVMTDQDIKDFTEVEVALISFVKICLAKKDVNAIIMHCMTDGTFQGKLKAALENCQSIPAELKNMTIAKWISVAKVAFDEVTAS